VIARRHNLPRERGFSLVSAIFLLVVLAGLGVYAVRINTMQQQTVTASLRGAQAFHAARAGIAWGAYRSFDADTCVSGTLNLTEGAASGFTVSVTCTQSSHTEGTTTMIVFVLEARAESGAYGGPDYVSRRLQAKFIHTV
jgi:MSHA biogenesis protein MshP